MSTETAPPHTTSHQHPSLRRELVTNAVNAKTLPGREILAEVVLTERELRIEVTDASEGQPELRCAGALDEGGRGLVLVDALASEWGTGPRDGVGKVVWVTLNLPEKAPR